MNRGIREQITELNQNYNDLGEDLLIIESVIIASRCENEFPSECITSSLHHVIDYTGQHLEEIEHLAKSLIQKAPPCRENP